MNITTKSLTVGFSVGLGIPVLYNFIRSFASEEKGARKLDKKRFVGIELGMSNYNVAIGEAITNNRGEIADFNIIKRKNGITSEVPEKTLGEIIKFVKEN
jgi:hypothetical protein